MRSSNWFMLFALAVVISLAASCRASGPKYDEISSSMPPVPAQHARVYFFRDSNVMGSGVQPTIYFDGQAVGKSEPSGFFFVDAPAGDHQVTTTTEVERALSFTLVAGETRYVRTYCTPGVFAGHVSPELVEPSEGEREVRRCRYNGVAFAKLEPFKVREASALRNEP